MNELLDRVLNPPPPIDPIVSDVPVVSEPEPEPVAPPRQVTWQDFIDGKPPLVAFRLIDGKWQGLVVDRPDYPITQHEIALLFTAVNITIKRHRRRVNFGQHVERRKTEAEKQREINEALEASRRRGTLVEVHQV